MPSLPHPLRGRALVPTIGTCALVLTTAFGPVVALAHADGTATTGGTSTTAPLDGAAPAATPVPDPAATPPVTAPAATPPSLVATPPPSATSGAANATTDDHGTGATDTGVVAATPGTRRAAPAAKPKPKPTAPTPPSVAATPAPPVDLPTVAPGSVQPATAAQLDAFLATRGSPLAGQGAAFVAAGGAWGVDPRLLVSVAGAESSFGLITCGPFNAWGYGCPGAPRGWDSWAAAIDGVAHALRRDYLAEGRTSVALIGAKYAPVGAANDPTGLNNAWTVNVSRFLLDLGGNPQDVDAYGVGGTLAVGPVGSTTGAASFAGGGAATTAAAPAPAPVELTVGGASTTLRIEVVNTGSATWNAEGVRLRRTDDDARVVGAPYAALVGGPTAPGATATFQVDLAAAGLSAAQVPTSWQLEGPDGTFGDPVARPVDVVVDDLAVGAVDPAAAAVQVAPGGTTTVELRLRNDGSSTWVRDGDDRVLLGVTAAAGAAVAGPGWLSPTVPAGMLERTAAPGEWATFAFRVGAAPAAGAATLQLRPFRAGVLASGTAAQLQVTTLPG